jgi:hypothetical protein
VQNIVYELKLEDMVAFADHQVLYAPYNVKNIRRMQWVWAIFFAAAAGMAVWFNDAPAAAIFGILCIVFMAYYPHMVRSKSHIQNEQFFQLLNSAHFGRHELTLEIHQLRNQSEAGETTIKISVLDRLEETSNYFYIYVTPYQAIVVPKRQIMSGDLDRLMSELGQSIPVRSF